MAPSSTTTWEAATDAVSESAWTGPGADELLDAMRPLAKKVLDAGVLPGTKEVISIHRLAHGARRHSITVSCCARGVDTSPAAGG